MSLVNPARQVWQTFDVQKDFNPPILNTLHEVINISGGCRLVAITVIQSNTPTGAEEIDVLITKDGTPILYDGSAIAMMNHNNSYGIIIYSQDATQAAYATINALDIGAVGYTEMLCANYMGAGHDGKPLEGETILVQVRQTSAIAAGARIRVFCRYERLLVI